MRDTTSAAEQIRLAAIRGLNPAERIRQVFDLSEYVRRLAFTGLRARFPNRSDLELAELYAGTPLALPGERSFQR